MAKFKERQKARDLRRGGESIQFIAKKLKISKSTASLWCRDVELTAQQIKKLEKRMVDARYRGRIKGAKTQKERRLALIEHFKEVGKKDIKDLDSE